MRGICASLRRRKAQEAEEQVGLQQPGDAVANGNEIMRVEGGGDIKFTEAAMSLTEDMVGEIILVLASLRVNDDDVKQSWLWELICWGP